MLGSHEGCCDSSIMLDCLLASRSPRQRGFGRYLSSRFKGATETLYLAVSSIRSVERDVPSDRALPAVAVREEAFLVVVELLGCLGRELDVCSQDDGVDRAGLLTEAAVDAFHHVDVKARGSPRAVVAPLPRLDGDGLCRADRLTQLAGDATLFPIRIA